MADTKVLSGNRVIDATRQDAEGEVDLGRW